MIDVDDLDEFFEKIQKNNNILKEIREKKQIFVLPAKAKSNLSDLLDVVEKYHEIKKLVSKSFKDQKLSPEEIEKIISQFNVAEKIAKIIMEDQKEYEGSVSILNQFYELLMKTIGTYTYVIDIHKELGGHYNSDKINGWVINEESIVKLGEFLNECFLLVHYEENNPQYEFEIIISNIIRIFAFIEEKLNFNVAYVQKPALIEQFYIYQQKFYHIGHIFKILSNNNSFVNLIPSIINGLKSLQEKSLKSKDQMIGITSWGMTRQELSNLNDLLKDF